MDDVRGEFLGPPHGKKESIHQINDLCLKSIFCKKVNLF